MDWNKINSKVMEDKTSNSRQTKLPGGKGKLTPAHNPKPFTSSYQPGKEKSKETLRKQKTIRDSFKALLRMKYKFDDGSKIKEQLVKAFGKQAVENMTVGEIMALQQMQKAIKLADTQAFSAALNQALGMPKQ